MHPGPGRGPLRDVPNPVLRRGADALEPTDVAASPLPTRSGRLVDGPPGRVRASPGEDVRRGLRRLLLVGIATILILCITITIAILLLFSS